MSSQSWSTTVSIYFYTGDFADVLRRYERGEQQIYATHDEVARLLHGLVGAGVRVNVFSFVTPEVRDERPLDGLRVVSLGANRYSSRSTLAAAVRQDDADAIVVHFPNVELLEEVIRTGKRAMAILASSYNRRGLRPYLETRKLASLLNNARLELVSNHCLPATCQLAELGVAAEKLIAWDVPHRFHPKDFEPKQLLARRKYELAYAGSIFEQKGVGDIIRAVALLREEGLTVGCSLAGLGDVDEMQLLASHLGVSDLSSFRGLMGNDDVFTMFRAADVIAVPSHAVYPEGFPLTMFEAIAARTPIICTDHPMFRPVLKDSKNAAVFRAGDVRGFAAAIRRTLTGPELYETLSRNAPSTWAALEGPADWRTLITRWVTEGSGSSWIRDHMLRVVEI